MPDHKGLIARWFHEVRNEGRRETIYELLAEDCIIHDGDTDSKGPAEFEVFFKRLQPAFSATGISIARSEAGVGGQP